MHVFPAKAMTLHFYWQDREVKPQAACTPLPLLVSTVSVLCRPSSPSLMDASMFWSLRILQELCPRLGEDWIRRFVWLVVMPLCQILNGKGSCSNKQSTALPTTLPCICRSGTHTVLGCCTKSVANKSCETAMHPHPSEPETPNQPNLGRSSNSMSVLDPSTHGDSKLITLAMSFSSVRWNWLETECKALHRFAQQDAGPLKCSPTPKWYAGRVGLADATCV